MTQHQDELMDKNASPSEEHSKTPQNPQPDGITGMGLLAQVSTLAWNLVLPIVGGVLLGNYLDRRRGDGVTWTMSLLVLGVIIALSNLYNLYVEHGQQKEKQDDTNPPNQVKNEEVK